MGVNLSQLNLDNVDANAVLEAIPAGWYNVQIIGSEMKPTKDNATTGGQYMELTLQIIDGVHAGRKLFDRLNLVNQNPTAVEIAFKTMKSIYNSLGLARVNDSTELHGKPLKAKVKVRAASGDYDANNEVQGYDSANSNHTPAGVTAGGVAGSPVGSPPWATQGAPAAAAPAAAAPAAGGAPWAQGGAAAQPWAQPGAGAPAGGPPPFTPPAAAAPVDPMSAARADGWQAHPQHPGYSWRGQDVVEDAQLMAHYPVAQAAPPVAAGGPPPFTPPAGAPAAAPATQSPPWAAAAPAAAAPAQQFAAPAAATPGAAGPTPPWAR